MNGFNAELIDYRPIYDKSLKRKIKNIGVRVLFYKQHKERYLNYKKFQNEYLNILDEYYSNFDELMRNVPQYDLYITGSNQVWNTYFPCGRDKAYTL